MRVRCPEADPKCRPPGDILAHSPILARSKRKLPRPHRDRRKSPARSKPATRNHSLSSMKDDKIQLKSIEFNWSPLLFLLFLPFLFFLHFSFIFIVPWGPKPVSWPAWAGSGHGAPPAPTTLAPQALWRGCQAQRAWRRMLFTCLLVRS